MLWVLAKGKHLFLRLWRYWERRHLDVWWIVICLSDDDRTLGGAVMVAIAIDTPLKCKGGRAYGGLVVFVTTVDAIFKSFKGTSKVWSRYWHSSAFRCESSDKKR